MLFSFINEILNFCIINVIGETIDNRRFFYILKFIKEDNSRKKD